MPSFVTQCVVWKESWRTDSLKHKRETQGTISSWQPALPSCFQWVVSPGSPKLSDSSAMLIPPLSQTGHCHFLCTWKNNKCGNFILEGVLWSPFSGCDRENTDWANPLRDGPHWALRMWLLAPLLAWMFTSWSFCFCFHLIACAVLAGFALFQPTRCI